MDYNLLISIIVAMDRHGLIGDANGLPWRLPADLRRFRSITMGKPIIMGRTTHELIGRPLDGRPNLILTRDASYRSEGCTICTELEHAFDAAKELVEGTVENEVLIIGGAQVYQAALPACRRLYLTIVDGEFSGVTYFPMQWMMDQSWKVLEHERFERDDRNPHAHQYLVAELDATGGPLPIAISPRDPPAARSHDRQGSD